MFHRSLRMRAWPEPKPAYHTLVTVLCYFLLTGIVVSLTCLVVGTLIIYGGM